MNETTKKGSRTLKTLMVVAIFVMLLTGEAQSQGCKIGSVDSQSAADKAGLRVGNIILAVNGKTITTHTEMVAAIGEAGQEATLIVQRGGLTENVTVALQGEPGPGRRLGVSCEYGYVPVISKDLKQVYSDFKPFHSLSVGLGGLFPLAELDTGYANSGEQTIGSTGYLAGAQYLYEATPRLGLGLEASWMATGKNEFSMYPYEGELSLKSTVILLLAKFHSVTSDELSPYVLFGIGAHTSEFTWDIKPSPGYTWASGAPNDARSVVSGKKSNIAMALGAGCDLRWSSAYFMSLEGRLDVLGKTKHDATPLGNDIGLIGSDAGGVHGSLILRVGMRFGEKATARTPVQPEAPAKPAEPSPTPLL